MEYEDLAAYMGSKLVCGNCEREFQPGEVISVNPEQNLALCYSDTGGGCVLAYVFSSGKMMACKPMRFRDAETSGEKRTPNYPNTPP